MSDNFSEFKERFYSRIPDLSILDCEEFNLLKVVLDGLKVNYVSKNVPYRNMFKPMPVARLIYFAKRIKHRKNISRAQGYVTELAGYSSRPCLLINNGRSVILKSGKPVSYYFHNIEMELGEKNCITIYEEETALTNGLSLSNLIFLTRFKDYSKDERKMISSLRATYSRIEKTGVFSEIELLNIQIAINKFFNEYRLWNEITNNLNSHICIFETHYHREGALLALKRKRIKAVELQHGLIASEDIFYLFPAQVKEFSSRALFPDKIFTYGKFWSELLHDGSEFRDDQIEVLGQYQVINTWISDVESKHLNNFLGDYPFILITTQTFLHDQFIEYTNWLAQDLHERGSKCRVIVKKHPVENASLYNVLNDLENVQVTEINIEYLLSKCLCQVSIYSTTLFEGLKYNCPNFSLDVKSTRDYVDSITIMGVSRLISMRENPLDLITDVNKPVVDSRHFFDDFESNKYKLTELINFQNTETKTIQCSRCVLDTSDDPDIVFDQSGVCSYCQAFDKMASKDQKNSNSKERLSEKVNQIIDKGRGKRYDCVLGVSGGIDSTYVAYWAKQVKLRPLIVHVDNGWDSELAVCNIQMICDKLGFELETIILDWEEFKSLQRAFLRAGVVDIELLTDHAIHAALFKVARKRKLRYIITGDNNSTESIMPKRWTFDKLDWANIKDIHRRFGERRKIKYFPHISFLDKLYLYWIVRVETVSILNYLNYKKNEAKSIVQKELDWRDYGGKHYESVFTKFYQAYILPFKFGIDKRKAHFSTLINSGQMTKQEAGLELSKPLYNEKDLAREREYIIKKLGYSETEFEQLMNGRIRMHDEFKSEKKYWKWYFRVVRLFKIWK